MGGPPFACAARYSVALPFSGPLLLTILSLLKAHSFFIHHRDKYRLIAQYVQIASRIESAQDTEKIVEVSNLAITFIFD